MKTGICTVPRPADRGGTCAASTGKAPPGHRLSPVGRACIGGAVFLAVLVGMSVGTAVLPVCGPGGEAGQVMTGLTVAGGLLIMLGCGIWVLRGAPVPPVPRAGRPRYR